ncbi:MAG: hypothetical protein HKP25_08120 [Marinicaulis sp.]|nr:hypothetical protein [Marinicaulis sp.]
MFSLPRNIKTILLSVLALTAAATPAFADSAAEKAKARLAEMQAHQTRLAQLTTQINNFPIKDVYCNPTHPKDKSSDRTRLNTLIDQATAEMRALSNIRRILIRTVTRSGPARNTLDHVIPGGSSAIVDGSLFKDFNRLRNDANSAKRTKTAALNSARTRNCGKAGAPVRPAFVVDHPLTDIVMTTEYKPVSIPTTPVKFCHEDEKYQLLRTLRDQRYIAHMNGVAADRLGDRLRKMKPEIEAKKNTAFNAADEAAKGGDNATFNEQQSQHDAYKTALKNLQAKINQAQADEDRWNGIVDDIDAQIASVDAMPITDCTPANLTPAGALNETKFGVLTPEIAAPRLREVDIPSSPKKVCVAAVKSELETNSYAALNNARHNLSQWNARMDKINAALKTTEGGAQALLSGALDEARGESSKWIKIVGQAEAANKAALAIIVEDCSGEGGLLETGKYGTAMPGVHAGVPGVDMLSYDLPEVPGYACSWEEKQALIERAAKAREAASHNHGEWAPRAAALGKLLYGETAVGGDRTELLNAHAEARAQSDYWADQMLDVAHKVYWDLRELEIRECGESKTKTSMGDYRSGGKREVAAGGPRSGALLDAMNSKPVFNGGISSGYGGLTERDCIIREGGCFYPDPRLDGIYDPSHGEGGFDGSEAEAALEHTLRGVKTSKRRYSGDRGRSYGEDRSDSGHVHTPDCDHGASTGREYDEIAKPKAEASAPRPTPSTDTPLETERSEPTSAPAPVGKYSEVETGRTSGAVEPKPCITGVDRTCGTSTVLYGLPKKEIFADPKSLGSSREAPSLETPMKDFYETGSGETISTGTASSETGTGGSWVQVKPPVLIIDARTGKSITTKAATREEEEKEERTSGE